MNGLAVVSKNGVIYRTASRHSFIVMWLHRFVAFLVFVLALTTSVSMAQDVLESPDRGLLANPILFRQPVKSVYFFAGNWRNPFHGTWYSQYYEKPLMGNISLYTQFPSDPKHLGWSEAREGRIFALNEMQAANVNVVTMSYWGARDDDRWAFWAPMHTSTYAHDQLFDEATTRNIVIIPAIESGRCTEGAWQGFGNPEAWEGTSWSFNFASEFPYFRGNPAHPNPYPFANPAPALTRQIKDLLQRYVISPADPLWPSRWAQIYDRTGTPRYAINLIHVASNQIGPEEHVFFARAFDDVANAVLRDTGQRVGFTLDIIPMPPDHPEESNHFSNQKCGDPANDLPPKDDPASWWRDSFLTYPETTGPVLRQSNAVLAIQAFIPEVWTGILPDESRTRQWKIDWIRRWVANGPPVFLDVSPGYATHEGFDSNKPVSGWGWNDDWLNFQSELKASGIRGITLNTWNGYTEGFAAVPVDGGIAFRPDRTVVHFRPPGQTDNTAYEWLKRLYASDPRICDHWQFVNRQPTHHVWGAICDKWRAMGGVWGALGPPTSSEYALLCRNGAQGRQTDFAAGAIIYSDERGAFEVHGGIAEFWRHMGGACGTAGFPLSDESGPPDLRFSKFVNGTIFWSSSGASYAPN